MRLIDEKMLSEHATENAYDSEELADSLNQQLEDSVYQYGIENTKLQIQRDILEAKIAPLVDALDWFNAEFDKAKALEDIGKSDMAAVYMMEILGKWRDKKDKKAALRQLGEDNG